MFRKSNGRMPAIPNGPKLKAINCGKPTNES